MLAAGVLTVKGWRDVAMSLGLERVEAVEKKTFLGSERLEGYERATVNGWFKGALDDSDDELDKLLEEEATSSSSSTS